MTSDILVDHSYGLLVVTIFFTILPFVAAVWALLSLARLQRGRTEMLARLEAIERRLAPDPSQSASRFR